MSTAERPKATRMTICDLCDKEIPDGTPDETGSITAGYIEHPVTPKTKHVWLRWPPPSRSRRSTLRDRLDRPREYHVRVYDFHAECILRLVEEAVVPR